MIITVLNSGDTAWMLISTALVVLMTIPGLALFYSGLVKKENMLNTLFLSFAAYAVVSVIWFIYGYQIVFGADVYGIIGMPSNRSSTASSSHRHCMARFRSGSLQYFK
jgi:Amt family ammonium transporter